MPKGIYKRTEDHRIRIKEAMNRPDVKKRMSVSQKKRMSNPKNNPSYGKFGPDSFGWKGGVCEYETYHAKARKLFRKNKCEVCGMTNEEHKKRTGHNLSIHNNLKPKDYTVMESYAWTTVCEFGCHQTLEKGDIIYGA